MSHRERGRNVPASRRRDKYSSRACRACQHRKSKCSGHDPCHSCQERDLPCTYGTQKRRGRQPATQAHSELPGCGQGAAPVLGSLLQPDGLEPEPNSEGREPKALLSRSAPTNSLPSYRSARCSLYRCVGTDSNRLSLRSQIARAQGLFSATGAGKCLQHAKACDEKVVYSIELPDMSQIQRSVHGYFEVATGQYPALHPDSTQSRIHQILEYLQYPPTGDRVEVDEVAAPTVALLCAMIAISASTRIDTSSSTTNDLATLFLNHARNLLYEFEFLPPSREILQCHTLVTIQLLHMDFLDLAIQSSAVTTRLALFLRFHQRLRYSPRESDIASYDQNLWWTVYILDRNIAYLSGTPGLIKDEDIDAPSPIPDHGFKRFCDVKYTTRPSEPVGQREQDASFLDVCAHIWRLWGRTWNNLAPDSSPLNCHWEAAEVIDTQLRAMQQRLPPTLAWRHLPRSDAEPDQKDNVSRQRRLIILMRINTLRLLTRQDPLSHCTCIDRTSPHSHGTAIAAETIEAIACQVTRSEMLLPIGQLTSATLVQCILYLVDLIAASKDQSRTESASTSATLAYKTLVSLSCTCLSAMNAVIALDSALFEHGGSPVRAQVPRQHAAATSAQRSQQSHKMNGAITDDPDDIWRRASVATLGEQVSKGDDMIACLRQGYESLDSTEAECNA